MALDYNQLEHYLTRADADKRAGFDHPDRVEEPIGKQEGAQRFVSTSARTDGSTILTSRKQEYLLHAHDYPPNLLEQTDDGWIFRSLPRGDLELRTQLLDNGQTRTQESWHTDYRETREGQEGWRLPTTEEAVEMFYSLLLLNKDPRHHLNVQLILGGDEQNNVPGLRQNLNRWPVFADHIEYGSDLKAKITNPYGKDEKVVIPEYENNSLVLASEQPEGLLGMQKTPDSASWLEGLVGSKWAELPQIFQFIAPRIQRNVQYMNQGGEVETSTSEPHLREARVWIPSQQNRNIYRGRVVSLDFVDDGSGLGVVIIGRVYDVRPALGVRTPR